MIIAFDGRLHYGLHLYFAWLGTGGALTCLDSSKIHLPGT